MLQGMGGEDNRERSHCGHQTIATFCSVFGCVHEGDQTEKDARRISEDRWDLHPGQSALQWILSIPYSTAICFVSSTTAPLDAQ